MLTGAHALMMLGMGGRKRKRSDYSTTSSFPSSPSSVCSAAATEIADIHDTVPKWVMNGFMNALHRVTMGSETFSANNFKQEPGNHDDRGMPELALKKEYVGTSYSVRRGPCIVSAVIDGIVTVHKGNKGYMWIAKTARVKNTREQLVYMKCWDPDCQSRIKKFKQEKESNMAYFDCYGWALLDKNNMQFIDSSSAS